jgi:hypothetical protein
MPKYDAITPTQWVLFLWAALITFSIMWWLFWHIGRASDAPIERDEAGPEEIVARAWLALLHWRPFLMVSEQDALSAAADTDLVHVPIPRPGTNGGTSERAADETPHALPDTDAPDNGTLPRLSTRLSDSDTIALLTTQRGKDGKHRYSANQIHTLVGGARADVLAQVRALRDGSPAVFRALTDEQQQLRTQLQLDQQ